MEKQLFTDGWSYGTEGQPMRPVTLPHDALLSQPRSRDCAGGSACGFFESGVYVYEKHFLVPESWKEHHLILEFEGVYRSSTVYINGTAAGGAAYGYAPFFVTLDDFLRFGEENTVRVVADAKGQPDSRWYPGGGIYRPVWLWNGPKDSIEPESVQISTVSYDPAVIRVRSPKAVCVTVGAVSGSGTDFTLTIPEAKLWSEDSPTLYTASATNGTDHAELCFGIRHISWSAEGLFVNGRRTLLRGGCIHHDNGIVGAAAYDESEFRRARILKEQGFNALRMAHNPCSRAMLDACDKLGLYVIDELWDMWFSHKNKYDYASDWQAHHMEDLRAVVRRDYNHPCVIMYSLGNEVSEPAVQRGVDACCGMAEYLQEADPGRAVTAGLNLAIIASSKRGKGVYDDAEGGRKSDQDEKMRGMNSTMFNLITNVVGSGMNKAANLESTYRTAQPVIDALDIAGYNYASGRYPLEGKRHPGKIIYGSETFHRDIAKNWAMVKKYPYVLGDFMWTAWDYLGEAGLGAWAYTDDGRGFSKPYPWLLADSGAIDILGDPGAPMALARAAWEQTDTPAICVRPVNHPGVKPYQGVWRGSNAIASWSWRGCEGNPAVIEVYSSAYSVELLLNGKKIGRKRLKNCTAVFKTGYTSGELTAVCRDKAGTETGRSTLVSADRNLQLRLTPEQNRANSGEIIYIPVTICGRNGSVEANADETLTACVENGELLGFGSANPRTEESYQSGSFRTYYGRALAVIRTGKNGTTKLTVCGESLAAQTAEVKIR